MRRIHEVKLLDGYRLDLTFDDGTHSPVDLSYLVGKGVFSAWNDRRVFAGVRIGPSGELIWDNEIDLCPDALYLKVTGRSPEQVFPDLKNEPSHA